MIRNKNKFKKTLPPSLTHPFFLGSTSLPTLLSPPPERHRRMGKRGCDQFAVFHVYWSFLLMLSLSSSVGSLQWDTVLHTFLQYGSFSWAASLQELLQPVSFPRGGILQDSGNPSGVDCSSMGHAWGHRSCQKNFWVGFSTQAATSFRAHAPALAWCPPQAAGYLLHGLQGNLFSTVWRTPPPPSLLTLMSAQLFLSHIHTLLFQLLMRSSSYPFLNMLPQRFYQSCWRAQLWPVTGPSQNHRIIKAGKDL